MTEVPPSARRVRGPAYAVMMECLRIQATARPQSVLARLFGRDPILPDARTWYRGALGEIRVAKTLKALDPGWTVLHAQDAPALVIGPAGAFAVSTRNHSRQRVWLGDGRLLVNGRRTDHLPYARLEAQRIGELIGGPVIPVIAVVDPASLTIKQRAEGVEVLASSQLGRYLARRKARLTDAEAAELVAAAAASGVWDPDVVDETLRHEARFLRLKSEVEAAARRRLWWVAGGSLAVVVPVLVWAL